MSNAQKAQDFVTSFMKNLAEGVELTPSLQAVFAKILAEQVVVDADTNVVNFKPAFSTLLKVLTFIATPEDKRPEAGYTQEAIDTAADSAATETGLTVGEEIPTEAPTEEPTDGPTDEPTEEPTDGPTDEPTDEPTDGPTDEPTEEPGIEGNTLELTTGADVIAPLAEGEEAVEGVQYTTENDDVINGLAGSYATKTLQDTDQIDGGAGHDTLNVELAYKFGGFKGDGFLKNVEVVNLTNTGKSAKAFEAKGVTGVETYNLEGLVDLNNLASADVAVNVANRDSGTVKIAYATDVTKDTEDVLNLGVTNVGTAEVKDAAGKVTTKEAIVKVEADNIETLNLNATGVNLVNLVAAGTKAVNIAGAGSVDVEKVATTVTNVDASGLEGKLNLNLAGTTDVISVQGGAGDDVITAGSGSLAISAVVNGGEGNDKLVLDGVTGTYQLEMDGVETIKLDKTAGLTYSATKTAGLENLEVTGAITGGVVFAGMDGDIKVTLDGASGSEVSSDHDGVTTLEIKSAGNKTTPGVVTTDVSATKSVELNATVDQFTNYSGSITAAVADAASLTLNGGVITGAELELGAAESLVINDNNKAKDELILKADKLLELTVNVANAMDPKLASGDFTLESGSTSLKGLKALNVNTNGKFDATDVDLEVVSDLNLMGSGAVILGDLGTNTAEDGISITAVGLAGYKDTTPVHGLTVGDIATGKGNSVDINIAEVLGSVKLGSITIADDTSPAGKSGTITIEANGTMGDIIISGSATTQLTAKEVNFNAAEALGSVGTKALAASTDAVTANAITITADTVDFIGSGLGHNAVKVTADKATIVGGIKADYIEVNGTAKTLATAELTGGLGADVFNIVAATNTTSAAIKQQLFVTITDFKAGEDSITGFTGGVVFASSNFTSSSDAIASGSVTDGGTDLILEFVTGTGYLDFFKQFNDFDGVSGLTKDNTKLAVVNVGGTTKVTGLLDNNGDFYTFNKVASDSASVLVKLVGVTTDAVYDFAVAVAP